MSNPISNIIRRMKSIKLSDSQRTYCLNKMEQIKQSGVKKDWFAHGISHNDLNTYLRAIVDGKGYSNADYYLPDDCKTLEFKVQKSELSGDN